MSRPSHLFFYRQSTRRSAPMGGVRMPIAQRNLGSWVETRRHTRRTVCSSIIPSRRAHKNRDTRSINQELFRMVPVEAHRRRPVVRQGLLRTCPGMRLYLRCLRS